MITVNDSPHPPDDWNQHRGHCPICGHKWMVAIFIPICASTLTPSGGSSYSVPIVYGKNVDVHSNFIFYCN